MYHKINFDSNTQKDYSELEAPYYNAIIPSEITFINENISATADSLGHIEFFDMERNSLGFVDYPVSKDPSEKGHTAQYGNMRCMADGKEIRFQLPIYGWEDYYPHCDGESDRWARYIAGWFSVIFDCSTHQISREEESR